MMISVDTENASDEIQHPFTTRHQHSKQDEKEAFLTR